MSVRLAEIRPILTVADICDVLRISHTQFYMLKDAGVFDRIGLLREVMPPIDRKRRYLGDPFVEWLSSKRQQQLWREELRATEAMA